MWHHSAYGWALESVIDIEEKLRSMNPGFPHGLPPHIWFSISIERSNAVLPHTYLSSHGAQTGSLPVLLDLETWEMLIKRSAPSSTLLEIDLPSRLRAMKIFS